jgi:phage FluMu protein gp41
MAQAKTRASTKRSGGSRKPQVRSRGSTSKSSKSQASRAKSQAPRSPSSNGSSGIESARRTVEGKARDAGHAVGSAASKAKIPLVAGGAALAGAAGGLALGTRQRRRHGGLRGSLSRRPQVKVSSRDLAKVAKEVGSAGAQVGHFASELQQAREMANGSRHRSPVEVVLEGLTARRSRA